MASGIQQTFGSDLATSPSGDIAISSDTQASEERVIRRLFTNPGDYIFHPDYGAGLPQFVGRPATSAQITAIILSQMKLESSVAQIPAPQVTTTMNPNGTFFVSILYVDAVTQQTVPLNLPVTS